MAFLAPFAGTLQDGCLYLGIESRVVERFFKVGDPYFDGGFLSTERASLF